MASSGSVHQHQSTGTYWLFKLNNNSKLTLTAVLHSNKAVTPMTMCQTENPSGSLLLKNNPIVLQDLTDCSCWTPTVVNEQHKNNLFLVFVPSLDQCLITVVVELMSAAASPFCRQYRNFIRAAIVADVLCNTESN